MDVLVVDGYNMIGAWTELNRLKAYDIGIARTKLLDLLSEYQAFYKRRVIVVFDALYVKGKESKQKHQNIEVIYTKEDETADECIERLVKQVKNVKNQVYVATNDFLEQRTIFSRGALRISSRELQVELSNMDVHVKDFVEINNYEKPASRIQIDEETLEDLQNLLNKNNKKL